MKIDGEHWETYLAPLEDGGRAVVSFDVAIADEQEHVGFPHCRRVVFFFHDDEILNTGLPTVDASYRMKRLERGLLDALRADQTRCRFVGRLTYHGLREHVFQVEDLDSFLSTVTRWHESAGRPEMRLIERDGWSFFDEHVKPAPEHWIQIHDQRVIDELVRAGSDPKQVHSLEFAFRGSPMLLRHLAQVLEKNQFEVRSIVGDSLFVIEHSRLEILRIWELSKAFTELATSRGVTYEGWGAVLVPREELRIREESLVRRDDGTLRIVLCQVCLGQVDPTAHECSHCATSLVESASLEFSLDEYQELPRVHCLRCDEPRLARAVVCPHCGAGARPERMAS